MGLQKGFHCQGLRECWPQSQVCVEPQQITRWQSPSAFEIFREDHRRRIGKRAGEDPVERALQGAVRLGSLFGVSETDPNTFATVWILRLWKYILVGSSSCNCQRLQSSWVHQTNRPVWRWRSFETDPRTEETGTVQSHGRPSHWNARPQAQSRCWSGRSRLAESFLFKTNLSSF